MRAGRPFRFLAVVAGGWVGLRMLVLWPAPDLPFSAPQVVGRAVAKPVAFGPVPTIADHGPVSRAPTRRARSETAPLTDRPAAIAIAAAPTSSAAPAKAQTGEPDAARPEQPIIVPRVAPDPARPSRWGGSIWAIARPSGPAGGLGSSQLGGAQAGGRITYALGEARRVALVGRVATPLEGRGREAALGVELRVPGAPVRLFAEQRFALDRGARGGPSAGVIAGLDRRLAAGFRLEAYGQAGAIRRDRLQGFADGAARVTRVAGEVGRATVDLGIGAWGGAQRGAERLDVGPTLGMSVPVGERRVRLTLDYRARVAGSARPGSGPALSLGTDF